MTVLFDYPESYLPTKYFSTAYRAFSDAQYGVEALKRDISEESLLLSNWKLHWVATVALLRSSIEFFKHDSAFCLSEEFSLGFKEEWNSIGPKNNADHPIYWEFLREERNAILHEYKWSAYERFLDPEGEVRGPTLLLLYSKEYDRELLIRFGRYKGCLAIDLVEEAAQWVEARIQSAFERAGLDPEEKRSNRNFSARPNSNSGIGTLLGKDSQT